jgi:hypothetical protein
MTSRPQGEAGQSRMSLLWPLPKSGDSRKVAAPPEPGRMGLPKIDLLVLFGCSQLESGLPASAVYVFVPPRSAEARLPTPRTLHGVEKTHKFRRHLLGPSDFSAV